MENCELIVSVDYITSTIKTLISDFVCTLHGHVSVNIEDYQNMRNTVI